MLNVRSEDLLDNFSGALCFPDSSGSKITDMEPYKNNEGLTLRYER